MNGPSALHATWFDGRTSRPRPALLRLVPGRDGAALRLTALDGAHEVIDFAERDVGWPERWSARRPPPRVVVDLRARGSLQIDDVPGWLAAVAAAGRRAPLAERMQTRWRVLLAVLLLAVGGIWAFYRWGTPWAAAQLTRAVPLAWEQRLAERALRELDDGVLRPSKLPPERQAELRAGFDKLATHIAPPLQRYPGYRPPLTLQFRSGLGPNAFALPGGTIVMTDAMLEHARVVPGTGEAALLGVLAHEIGHVQQRHGTRMVVEQGVLNIGLGLALGDVSALISTGASVLTGLAYQRSHEHESDCFALALLRQAGLPAAPMAALLLGIERSMGAPSRRASAAPAASAPPPPRADAAPPGIADWFSTHPDTAGRAARLKAGAPAGC